MNKEIMKKLGFEQEVKLVEESKCTTCKKPINPKDFRNGIGCKEYVISGLCQACQDEFFGVD